MTNPFHLFICGSGDSAAAVLWNTLWEPQARPAGNDRFPLPLGSIWSVHSAASEPQLSGSVISVEQDVMSVEMYPFHLREALISLNVNLREEEHRYT